MQDSNFEIFLYGIIAFLIMFIPTVWVILKVKRKVLVSKYRKVFLTILLVIPLIFMLIGGIVSSINLISVAGSPPVTAKIVDKQKVAIYRSLGRNYTVIVREPYYQYDNKPLNLYAGHYHEIGDILTIRVSSKGNAVGAIWFQVLSIATQLFIAVTLYQIIRITLNKKSTKIKNTKSKSLSKSKPSTNSDQTRLEPK